MFAIHSANIDVAISQQTSSETSVAGFMCFWKVFCKNVLCKFGQMGCFFCVVVAV